MTCERCGGDSGPYRMHPDPHVCVARLEADRDRLAGELADLRVKHDALKVSTLDEIRAEREAHAKTKAELVSIQGALLDYANLEISIGKLAEIVGVDVHNTPLASGHGADDGTCCQHVGDDAICQTCDALARSDRAEADLKVALEERSRWKGEFASAFMKKTRAEAILRGLEAWIKAQVAAGMVTVDLDRLLARIADLRAQAGAQGEQS